MNKITDIRKKIEGLSSLPTIPSVVTKLLRVIDSEEISIKRVGEFVSNDQVLSARVLKIVNSPIYGFPGRISSVSQALMLVGLSALKGMLLGISIFDVMQKTMLGLWEHSIGTALAARLIATRIGFKNTEDASVAGLIHDIGKVALSICCPREYSSVRQKVQEEDVYIIEAEKELLGVTHSQAGGWIAKKWHFPRNLVEAIGYHHKPALAKEDQTLVAIVHISDIIIKMMGFGFSGDPFVHSIDRSAWATLNLRPEDLKTVFRELEDALLEKEAFIF